MHRMVIGTDVDNNLHVHAKIISDTISLPTRRANETPHRLACPSANRRLRYPTHNNRLPFPREAPFSLSADRDAYRCRYPISPKMLTNNASNVRHKNSPLGSTFHATGKSCRSGYSVRNRCRLYMPRRISTVPIIRSYRALGR